MFKIEKTSGGIAVTIRETETVTLQDGSTREIELKNTTIGFGNSDFAADKLNPTAEEITRSRARMLNVLEKEFGRTLSEEIADATISAEQIAAARAEAAQAKADLESEKAKGQGRTTPTVASRSQ